MASSQLPTEISEHYTRLHEMSKKDEEYNNTAAKKKEIQVSLMEILAPCLVAKTPHQQKRLLVKKRKRREFNAQLRQIQYERSLLETEHQAKTYEAVPVFTGYLKSHDLFFSKLGTLQDHIERIAKHLERMKEQAKKAQGSLGIAIGLEALDVLGSTDLTKGRKRLTELALEATSTLASENQNNQAEEFNKLKEELAKLLQELNTLSEKIEAMRNETDTYQVQTNGINNIPQFTRYLERGDLLTGLFGKTEGISGITLLSHVYTAFKSGALPEQIEKIQRKLKQYDNQISYAKNEFLRNVMNDEDKLPLALE